MTIVFSILRSLLLAFLLSMSFLMPGPASPMNPLHGIEHFDVYIVDQQSVCVPLLRFLTGTRVVFYCHFPDKLLSGGWVFGEDKVERTEGGLLKKLYRWPIDKLEEWTTGTFSISGSYVLTIRSSGCDPFQLSLYLQSILESFPVPRQKTAKGGIPMYRCQPLPSIQEETEWRGCRASQIVSIYEIIEAYRLVISLHSFRSTDSKRRKMLLSRSRRFRGCKLANCCPLTNSPSLDWLLEVSISRLRLKRY
jgi:hypothetical protein